MPQTNPQSEVAEINTQAAHITPTPIPLTRTVKTKPAKKSLLHKSWLWCVVMPFIICCGYFGLIASDRYVGEAKVIVKQADNNSTADFGIALLGTAMSSGKQDAQLVRQFILSLDMLHYLNKSLSVRDHYQSRDVDHLSRLWEWQSQEDFLAYYRKHITVTYDELSGVLAIRAQAFTPEFAQKIVKAVLQQSEQYINQIGHDLASEQVNFVQKELDRATQHLRKSKQQILEFQGEYQLFSPEQESGAKLTMVNELEAQLTRHKAELNNLRSYMNDSAADIVALKAKIGSLENQLLIERAKLVGDKNNNFSDVNAKHADLLLDLGFATDLYKASLMSLEQARIEAYRKLKYLVVVDSPSLAEEAEFPKRLYNLVSILVVLSLLYGAMKITWATVKEHRDV
jgi:capsular polysaccharide transport system permease protein